MEYFIIFLLFLVLISIIEIPLLSNYIKFCNAIQPGIFLMNDKHEYVLVMDIIKNEVHIQYQYTNTIKIITLYKLYFYENFRIYDV